VNDGIGKMWNKAVKAYFKVLSWDLPGRTKENNEKLQLQPEQSVAQPIFEQKNC
jgi:hypothetical protein